MLTTILLIKFTFVFTKMNSTHKSIALTKEEVANLVQIIEANPVVYSKATNASNYQLKQSTWSTITDEFNSTISSSPRTPEQLMLKWENLKKAARKRSTKIRMNNLKTGGGKPDYIPPDDILEKVAVILGPTCDGYSVQFGGDAVAEQVMEVVEVEEKLQDPVVVDVPFNIENIENTPIEIAPASCSQTPQSKKFFFSSISKGKQKRQAISNNIKASVQERNQAIAEYYNAKRQNEAEIFKLKKGN